MTRTYIASSASANFTSTAFLPSAYYVVQLGSQYSLVNIETNTITWPSTYEDAWVSYSLMSTIAYIAFVNQVFYVDNGIASAPTYHLLDVSGPHETSPNVCHLAVDTD